MNIKNAFGNLIPAKVEVKMAHSGAASIINSNNSTNSTPNGKAATTTQTATAPTQAPITILQRNASQPIDIAAQSTNGAYGKSAGTLAPQQLSYNKNDKKKTNRRFDKNITFGTPIDDPLMDEEFDFEKNLALFDKQAIWDKIDANNQKPDLVRQTGHVNKKAKNYRHDENILTAKPTGHRQITLKDLCAQEYVTDDGVVIPTISLEKRSRIQMQAEVFGLDWERQCDMLSRSTVECCLNLLGGARRLSLKNQHQWPKIAIICDEMCNERHSEIGFSTGRQLATQGLQVHIMVKPNLNYALKSNREVELFKATGNAITMSIDGKYLDFVLINL